MARRYRCCCLRPPRPDRVRGSMSSVSRSSGKRVEPDYAVLTCWVAASDVWCRRCGCEGEPRDTVTRRLAHEPLGWRPTTLTVSSVATGAPAGDVWRQDSLKAASRGPSCLRRALAVGVGKDHASFWSAAGLRIAYIGPSRKANQLRQLLRPQDGRPPLSPRDPLATQLLRASRPFRAGAHPLAGQRRDVLDHGERLSDSHAR